MPPNAEKRRQAPGAHDGAAQTGLVAILGESERHPASLQQTVLQSPPGKRIFPRVVVAIRTAPCDFPDGRWVTASAVAKPASGRGLAILASSQPRSAPGARRERRLNSRSLSPGVCKLQEPLYLAARSACCLCRCRLMIDRGARMLRARYLHNLCQIERLLDDSNFDNAGHTLAKERYCW